LHQGSQQAEAALDEKIGLYKKGNPAAGLFTAYCLRVIVANDRIIGAGLSAIITHHIISIRRKLVRDYCAMTVPTALIVPIPIRRISP